MTNVERILRSMAVEFDIERIEKMTYSEKFKLAELAQLIYLESIWANQHGLEKLNKSPHYTFNKTYNLFATLLVNGISADRLKEIVLNYSKNFEKSNTYYAQLAILGMGILMINSHLSSESIYHYLLALLGRDFLMENLHYKGKPDLSRTLNPELNTEIIYKPFEGQMRDLKYELLALLRLRSLKGLHSISDFINDKSHDQDLIFYFNMLHIDQSEVAHLLYEKLGTSLDTIQKLKLSGAYAIIKNEDTYTTHYLFNSIIGKYSRYDKDTGEIESELQAKLMHLQNQIEG